jgi:hypothetical protein
VVDLIDLPASNEVTASTFADSDPRPPSVGSNTPEPVALRLPSDLVHVQEISLPATTRRSWRDAVRLNFSQWLPFDEAGCIWNGTATLRGDRLAVVVTVARKAEVLEALRRCRAHRLQPVGIVTATGPGTYVDLVSPKDPLLGLAPVRLNTALAGSAFACALASLLLFGLERSLAREDVTSYLQEARQGAKPALLARQELTDAHALLTSINSSALQPNPGDMLVALSNSLPSTTWVRSFSWAHDRLSLELVASSPMDVSTVMTAALASFQLSVSRLEEEQLESHRTRYLVNLDSRATPR